MLTPEEIEGIKSQNEVAILCGCAECGRRVAEPHISPSGLEVHFSPVDGAVIIRRQPEEVFSLEFPLCGECARRLVAV